MENNFSQSYRDSERGSGSPRKEEENIEPGIPEKIEVSPEVRERLEIIARIIGGDFGMKVDIADRPGIGSFFDSEQVKITFDPVQVAENPEEAEFVAAHEGGHRAISRSPDQIGVKDEKIEELYNSLGFGFLARSIEEPADNEWVRRKFAGIAEGMETVIKEMHRYEGDEPAVLTDPEVMNIIPLLGYVPKFATYGPQIERHWLMGDFSKDLDPKVREALERTIKDAEKAYLSIPDSHPTEKEVRERARRRFSITVKDVWPEFKKLVEEDVDQEKLRQMTSDMMKNAFENMRKALEDGEPLPGPLGELPEDLSQELREKMKQALDNLEQFLKEEGKKGSPQKGKEGDSQEASEGTSEDEKSEGEAGEESPSHLPLPELSEKLRKALEKIFGKLPQDDQERYEEEARETLEELEDALNKDLDPKLAASHAPHHQELDEREGQEEENRRKMREKEEAEQRYREIRRQLEEFQEQNLPLYEHYYREVSQLIEDLYERLGKILAPTSFLQWEQGYPSGQRLTLKRAKDYAADKGDYKKMWERKTHPEKRDYKITLLVDLSGSMFEGSAVKIQETFKGVVVLEETLYKLGIDTEVIGFTDAFPDDVFVFKSFGEEITDAVRQKMGAMLVSQNGWTPTSTATQFASDRLKEEPGDIKYLITLTDGIPMRPETNPVTESQQTHKVIQGIREQTNQRLVGIGLGPDTEHVQRFYPASVVCADVTAFPEEFADLVSDIIQNPAKYK